MKITLAVLYRSMQQLREGEDPVPVLTLIALSVSRYYGVRYYGMKKVPGNASRYGFSFRVHWRQGFFWSFQGGKNYQPGTWVPCR